MLNLKQWLGLDIKLDDTGKLILPENVSCEKSSVRTANDARNYFMDKNAKSSPDLYFMNQGICAREDCAKIKAAGFRFDVTVIPAHMIGQEYIKTIGHIHPYKPGTKSRYAEIYEIINGEALFILQKMNPSNSDIVEDVVVVRANRGEKAVMLPEYGHVTVNAGKEPLVMADWVWADFKSEYEVYEKHHGAAYYVVNKNNQIEFIPNKNYQNLPRYRIAKPKSILEFAADFSKPMYQQGLENNFKNLDFLKNPEKYREKLTAEYCYR